MVSGRDLRLRTTHQLTTHDSAPVFRQSGLLLPVSFVGFQVKRGMRFESRSAPILRAAAITHQRVGNYEIQHDVNERGHEQDHEREDQLVVSPGDTTRRNAESDDADSEPIRKIFPQKEVRAGTEKATTQTALVNRAGRNNHLLSAARTTESARFGRHGRPARLVAMRTQKLDIHSGDP